MTSLSDAQASFKPTDEQEAICGAIARGESAMVSAYAGTAKTTTLELAAKQVKVPALALAFNKKIAVEMQRRLPSSFKVQTFNGFGLGAWMRANPQVNKWEAPDGRKTGKLITQTAKDRSLPLSSEQWEGIAKLVAAAMNVGIVPGDQGRFLTEDLEPNWSALCDKLWIPELDRAMSIDMARDVLEQDIRLARQGITSYDDQVYCSTVLGGKFPQFPFMGVDEAQDLNLLNKQMLLLSARPGGQTMVVGDPKQAIYAFRGADANSMSGLRELRERWTDLRLTMTFRCPKVVVRRNVAHAPGFRAAESNPEGQFAKLAAAGRGPEPELADGWLWSDVEKALPSPSASIVVLCRNNAPLLKLGFKLIRRGVGVVMLGRDLGKGLVTLSRKILPDESTSAESARELVDEWMSKELALAAANHQDEKVAGITDRGGCLLAVLESAGVVNVGQMRAALERLFNRDVGRVTIGSIHQSKGLEWDLVLHLDPWRIPSKQAKEAALRGESSALVQEWNLLYVCETRTRSVLLNANLEDFQA